MPTIDELRETYARMSDQQLIQMAIHEAKDLIPSAVEVLREEVRKRNLPESLGLSIVAQTRDWTPQELEAMLNRVRQLPCPICGTTDHLLNVFRITTIRGFLVFTQVIDELVLGCPDCLRRAANRASETCVLALFHSPITAISASITNSKAKAAQTALEPTKEFTEYVLQNRGSIALALKAGHQQ